MQRIEVAEGIELWLRTRFNEIPATCDKQVVLDLLDEVREWHQTDRFPWEIIRVEKNIRFAEFGKRPPGYTDGPM